MGDSSLYLWRDGHNISSLPIIRETLVSDLHPYYFDCFIFLQKITINRFFNTDFGNPNNLLEKLILI